MSTQIAFFRFAIAAAVLIVSLGTTPSIRAAVSCGEILSANTTLDSDLACVGDGLVIGADGMTLDCAGHAIRGGLAYESVGVRVADNASVTIRRCTISGFFRAVRAERATDLTILENAISDNTTSVLMIAADRMRIESNRFERQFSQLTVRESSQARIAGNVFVPGRASRSLGSGVSISASPDVIVSDNEFLGPGFLFIHAEATSTVLERNVFGGALRPAAGQTWAGHAESLVGLLEPYLVPHLHTRLAGPENSISERSHSRLTGGCGE
jgi:hypothetical protein